MVPPVKDLYKKKYEKDELIVQTIEEIQEFKTGFFLTGIMLGVIGLVCLYLFMKNIRYAITSNKWPMVKGTIVSSRMTTIDDGYYPEISFSYNVSGVNYISTTFNPNELVGRSVLGKKSAEKKIESFPVGTPINVYYKPDDPKKAVIESGVTIGSLFFLVLAGMFLISSLIFTSIGLIFPFP
ncbi:MAG: DUF3592 domain-containing protein [Promethearchaeota archaeon]